MARHGRRAPTGAGQNDVPRLSSSTQGWQLEPPWVTWVLSSVLSIFCHMSSVIVLMTLTLLAVPPRIGPHSRVVASYACRSSAMSRTVNTMTDRTQHECMQCTQSCYMEYRNERARLPRREGTAAATRRGRRRSVPRCRAARRRAPTSRGTRTASSSSGSGAAAAVTLAIMPS